MTHKRKKKRMNVTSHAKKRMQQRCGIQKAASDKMADRAYRNGLTYAQASSHVKHWMSVVHKKNTNVDNIWIYNNSAWLFDGSTLITVMTLPDDIQRDMPSQKTPQEKKYIPENALHPGTVYGYKEKEFLYLGHIRTKEAFPHNIKGPYYETCHLRIPYTKTIRNILKNVDSVEDMMNRLQNYDYTGHMPLDRRLQCSRDCYRFTRKTEQLINPKNPLPQEGILHAEHNILPFSYKKEMPYIYLTEPLPDIAKDGRIYLEKQ